MLSRVGAALVASLLASGAAASSGASDAALAAVDPYVARPRVVVLTDIANEPELEK